MALSNIGWPKYQKDYKNTGSCNLELVLPLTFRWKYREELPAENASVWFMDALTQEDYIVLTERVDVDMVVESGYLLKLDLNGNLLRKVQLPAVPAYGAAIDVNDNIYVPFWDFGIYSYNANLEERWHIPAVSAYSPITVGRDSKIFVAFAYDDDDNQPLKAIDAESGTVIWARDIGTKFTYAVADDGDLLITGGPTAYDVCSKVDSQTGEIIWAYTISERPQVRAVSQCPDGTIIAASHNRYKVFALYPDGILKWECLLTIQPQNIALLGNETIVVKGYYPTKIVCLSSDGSIRWTRDTSSYNPPAMFFQNYLVVVEDDPPRVDVLDVQTGEVVSVFDTQSFASADTFAAITKEGSILFGCYGSDYVSIAFAELWCVGRSDRLVSTRCTNILTDARTNGRVTLL